MRYSLKPVVTTGGALLFTLALSACGGQGTKTEVIAAGQVDVQDVQIPAGWKSAASGAARSDSGATASGVSGAGGASTTSASTDTIPLAKEDPSSAFFTATGKFSQCLKDNGVKFIGAPDASNPASPVNDPNYLKTLTTCAAQSNIVQAMKDNQAAQAAQTSEQIQKSNEGFLVWRDCMIGKGWDIAKPTPDKEGRLFNVGGSGGSGLQIKAPPGKDILSSTDTSVCASEAQKQTGAGG